LIKRVVFFVFLDKEISYNLTFQQTKTLAASSSDVPYRTACRLVAQRQVATQCTIRPCFEGR